MLHSLLEAATEYLRTGQMTAMEELLDQLEALPPEESFSLITQLVLGPYTHEQARAAITLAQMLSRRITPPAYKALTTLFLEVSPKPLPFIGWGVLWYMVPTAGALQNLLSRIPTSKFYVPYSLFSVPERKATLRQLRYFEEFLNTAHDTSLCSWTSISLMALALKQTPPALHFVDTLAQEHPKSVAQAILKTQAYLKQDQVLSLVDTLLASSEGAGQLWSSLRESLEAHPQRALPQILVHSTALWAKLLSQAPLDVRPLLLCALSGLSGPPHSVRATL